VKSFERECKEFSVRCYVSLKEVGCPLYSGERTVGVMTEYWPLMSIQCHYFCVSCHNQFVSLNNFFLKIFSFHLKKFFPLLFLDLENLRQSLCYLGVSVSEGDCVEVTSELLRVLVF